MQTQVVDVGFGYSPYPHELSRNPGISLQAKGLFAVYGSFVSVTDSTAWPSESHLCKLCGGISNRTLHKYKRELLASGWIAQDQRRRENGSYSTLLITRYFHPSLNPHQATISTECKKTACGETACREMAVPEQETKEPNKKYTQTKAPCVSLGELMQEQKDCIEWTIAEALRNGTLKNPAGLRVVLTRAAHDGTLNMTDFEAAQAARRQKEQGSKEIIDQVGEWAKEAKENPITASFFEQQKKLYPALFT